MLSKRQLTEMGSLEGTIGSGDWGYPRVGGDVPQGWIRPAQRSMEVSRF